MGSIAQVTSPKAIIFTRLLHFMFHLSCPFRLFPSDDDEDDDNDDGEDDDYKMTVLKRRINTLITSHDDAD